MFYEYYDTFHLRRLPFLGRFLIFLLLNLLCSFSTISMISCRMLLVIGHVREIRHMYCYAVPTSEDFLKVGII